MTSIAAIQRVTAEVFGVALADLMGRSRVADIVTARHAAIFTARTLTGKSLPDIGRHFRRDHTSVLNAVRRIADRTKTDADLRARLRSVESRLAHDAPGYADRARNVEPLP